MRIHEVVHTFMKNQRRMLQEIHEILIRVLSNTIRDCSKVNSIDKKPDLLSGIVGLSNLSSSFEFNILNEIPTAYENTIRKSSKKCFHGLFMKGTVIIMRPKFLNFMEIPS